MNTQSDTPESDKKATDIIGFFSCATVPADFARKLERQRDALKIAADLMRDAMTHKPEVWNHAIDYYASIYSANA